MRVDPVISRELKAELREGTAGREVLLERFADAAIDEESELIEKGKDRCR